MTEHDAINDIENDIAHLEGIHALIVELINGSSEVGPVALFGLQKGIGAVLDGLREKHSILFHGAYGEPEEAVS